MGRAKGYFTEHSFQIESSGNKRSSQQGGKAKKGKVAPRPSNHQNTPKQKRTPLTPEERKERQSTRSKEKRAEDKANDVCRHCDNPPTRSQTRCDLCAEKHRVERRISDAKRYAKAKAERELARSIALQAKILAGGPTKCRECPKPPRLGQTRCDRCATLHIEYDRRSRAKKKGSTQKVE